MKALSLDNIKSFSAANAASTMERKASKIFTFAAFLLRSVKSSAIIIDILQNANPVMRYQLKLYLCVYLKKFDLSRLDQKLFKEL